MATSDINTFSDCVLVKDSRLYKLAVKRESMYWGKAFDSEQKNKSIIERGRRDNIHSNNEREWKKLPSGEWFERLKEGYYNKKLTGNPKEGPIEFLKALKHFDTALSLGAGIASFEFELIKQSIVGTIDIIDFSESGMRKKAKKAGFSSRMNLFSDDLNFIDLGKNKYDLIICRNILHHIVNLEHVLYEVNAALKKGGIFFIEDYIGENKFHWSDKRSALIKKTADMLPCIIKKKRTKTTEKDLINYLSPFESIRSEETPFIVDSVFKSKIKEVKCGEAFHIWEILVQPHQEECALDAAFDALVRIDMDITRQKILKPTRILGFYRKNSSPGSIKRKIIKRWDLDKIRDTLDYSPFSIPVIRQKIKAMLYR